LRRRRRHHHSGGRKHAVVPVVTTGLHCGRAAGRRWIKRLTRRPRRHDGAPLRRPRLLGKRDDLRQSSPSSRRGSIAASSRSRPSKHSSCRPRRHDGAPLRPPRRGTGRPGRCRVVPVVTTGLHCGAVVAALLSTGGTGRPRRHDGAPLRRLVEPVDARGQGVSSPSSRRGSIAASASPTAGTSNNVVVPVVTTGLHCGAMLTDEATRQGIVVPVVTTGLHCGVMDAAATRRLGVRRPRRHDGAPLRRRPDRNVVRRAGARSSPSSRRGSIAAMESPHEHLA